MREKLIMVFLPKIGGQSRESSDKLDCYFLILHIIEEDVKLLVPQ